MHVCHVDFENLQLGWPTFDALLFPKKVVYLMI